MSFKEIPLVYIGFCGIVGATLRDTFSINQFFFWNCRKCLLSI